jgi:hypothetical protein
MALTDTPAPARFRAGRRGSEPKKRPLKSTDLDYTSVFLLALVCFARLDHVRCEIAFGKAVNHTRQIVGPQRAALGNSMALASSGDVTRTMPPAPENSAFHLPTHLGKINPDKTVATLLEKHNQSQRSSTQEKAYEIISEALKKPHMGYFVRELVKFLDPETDAAVQSRLYIEAFKQHDYKGLALIMAEYPGFYQDITALNGQLYYDTIKQPGGYEHWLRICMIQHMQIRGFNLNLNSFELPKLTEKERTVLLNIRYYVELTQVPDKASSRLILLASELAVQKKALYKLISAGKYSSGEGTASFQHIPADDLAISGEPVIAYCLRQNDPDTLEQILHHGSVSSLFPYLDQIEANRCGELLFDKMLEEMMSGKTIPTQALYKRLVALVIPDDSTKKSLFSYQRLSIITTIFQDFPSLQQLPLRKLYLALIEIEEESDQFDPMLRALLLKSEAMNLSSMPAGVFQIKAKPRVFFVRALEDGLDVYKLHEPLESIASATNHPEIAAHNKRHLKAIKKPVHALSVDEAVFAFLLNQQCKAREQIPEHSALEFQYDKRGRLSFIEHSTLDPEALLENNVNVIKAAHKPLNASSLHFSHGPHQNKLMHRAEFVRRMNGGGILLEEIDELMGRHQSDQAFRDAMLHKLNELKVNCDLSPAHIEAAITALHHKSKQTNLGRYQLAITQLMTFSTQQFLHAVVLTSANMPTLYTVPHILEAAPIKDVEARINTVIPREVVALKSQALAGMSLSQPKMHLLDQKWNQIKQAMEGGDTKIAKAALDLCYQVVPSHMISKNMVQHLIKSHQNDRLRLLFHNRLVDPRFSLMISTSTVTYNNPEALKFFINKGLNVVFHDEQKELAQILRLEAINCFIERSPKAAVLDHPFDNNTAANALRLGVLLSGFVSAENWIVCMYLIAIVGTLAYCFRNRRRMPSSAKVVKDALERQRLMAHSPPKPPALSIRKPPTVSPETSPPNAQTPTEDALWKKRIVKPPVFLSLLKNITAPLLRGSSLKWANNALITASDETAGLMCKIALPEVAWLAEGESANKNAFLCVIRQPLFDILNEKLTTYLDELLPNRDRAMACLVLNQQQPPEIVLDLSKLETEKDALHKLYNKLSDFFIRDDYFRSSEVFSFTTKTLATELLEDEVRAHAKTTKTNTPAGAGLENVTPEGIARAAQRAPSRIAPILNAVFSPILERREHTWQKSSLCFSITLPDEDWQCQLNTQCRLMNAQSLFQLLNHTFNAIIEDFAIKPDKPLVSYAPNKLTLNLACLMRQGAVEARFLAFTNQLQGQLEEAFNEHLPWKPSLMLARRHLDKILSGQHFSDETTTASLQLARLETSLNTLIDLRNTQLNALPAALIKEPDQPSEKHTPTYFKQPTKEGLKKSSLYDIKQLPEEALKQHLELISAHLNQDQVKLKTCLNNLNSDPVTNLVMLRYYVTRVLVLLCNQTQVSRAITKKPLTRDEKRRLALRHEFVHRMSCIDEVQLATVATAFSENQIPPKTDESCEPPRTTLSYQYEMLDHLERYHAGDTAEKENQLICLTYCLANLVELTEQDGKNPLYIRAKSLRDHFAHYPGEKALTITFKKGRQASGLDQAVKKLGSELKSLEQEIKHNLGFGAAIARRLGFSRG